MAALPRREFAVALAGVAVVPALGRQAAFRTIAPGIRPPTADFLDGVAYDGRRPNAYLDSLAIGLKGDDTPATVQTTSADGASR